MNVGASGLDAQAARARVESTFAGLDLAPSWLAPSAILCVRSLRDPRARAVSLAHAAAPPRALRDALASELERLARVAHRPARGRVAANAESVLFADRAELLACLAADWCEQSVGACWWWRALFKQTPDRNAILNALAASPEYVPGVLAHLAHTGRAQTFAVALNETDARDLLDRLAHKFATRTLADALATALDETARGQAHIRARHDFSRDDTQRPRASDERRAPWASVAPEADAHDLSTAAKCLLGVGLSIARAPAILRRADFARRAFEWARDDLSGVAAREDGARSLSPVSADDPRERAPTEQADLRHEMREDAHGSDANADTREHTGHTSACNERPMLRDEAREHDDANGANAQRTRARSVSNGGARSSVERGERDDEAQACDVQVELDRERIGRDDEEVEPRAGSEVAARVASAERLSEAGIDLIEAEIATSYGGLFFLVNLALFLDLYGDFTAPAAPGLPLAVWDFVALTGRKLAGAGVERDPVWSLLARLSGRAEGTEPGEGFEPTDEWRAPVEWLKPFSHEREWLWSAAEDRLRVRHPAGFLVVDVSLRAKNVRGQLARELRTYREAFARLRLRRDETIKRTRGRTPRARWLERFTAYARARLHPALATRDARTLSRLLLERRARIFVTASHVDVIMSLAELPVEVRFSGLDRDPGWLPAAARHVAFHFE
jgi:hypothetical protein